MNEEWRDIKGYEGLYQVSNLGRVKSLKNNIILKAESDRNGKGYLCVNLGRNNHKKIHRLVAEAFIENPLNKKEVNHIDGNTKNNAVTNLEWLTHQENCLHYTYQLGQHNKQYKMRKVDMIGIDGKVIKSFPSISSAVRWLKENTNLNEAHATSISAVCLNKKSYVYGFKWKYREE